MTDSADAGRSRPRRVGAVILAGLLIAGCAWASVALGRTLRIELTDAAVAVRGRSVFLLWFTWCWGCNVASVTQNIRASLPFVTLAILLGVWRELLTIFPTILDLFHGGGWMQLWRPIVALTSAFFMLGIAGLSEPPKPDPHTLSGRAIYLVRPTDEPTPLVPSLPLFHFQNAEVRGGRLTERGLNLGPEEQASLAETLSALSRCGTSEKPVIVQVVGFASSTRFFENSQPRDDSEDLNVEVANARARAVYAILTSAAGGLANVVIRLHDPWEDFKKMEEERNRRQLEPRHIEEGERAAFQRVVTLDFLQTGRCKRLAEDREP